MSREVHVRFLGERGVRLLRATHLPLYRQLQIYAPQGRGARALHDGRMGRSSLPARRSTGSAARIRERTLLGLIDEDLAAWPSFSRTRRAP
jgi:hypothetical protein